MFEHKKVKENSFFDKIKNAKQSHLPILSFEWLAGLRQLEWPLNRTRPLLTFAFVVLSWSVQFYLIFWSYHQLDQSHILKAIFFDKLLNGISDYSNVFATLVFIITGSYYSKVQDLYKHKYFYLL